MLEELMKALIAAIEKNTAAVVALTNTASSAPAEQPKVEAKKPAKATTPPPEDKPATGPTVDEIRAKAQGYLDGGGDPAKVKEIAVKFGMKKISETAGTPHATEAMALLQKLINAAAV